jgi:hypothetical protein
MRGVVLHCSTFPLDSVEVVTLGYWHLRDVVCGGNIPLLLLLPPRGPVGGSRGKQKEAEEG